MALRVNIVDTEYQKTDGRDHLYYLIHISQARSTWENNIQLRYSQLRFFHKQLQDSQRLFDAPPLPKFPTWVRVAALFTNRMDEKTIEMR